MNLLDNIPQWLTLGGGFWEDVFLITEEECENLIEERIMVLWMTDLEVAHGKQDIK